MRIRRLGIYSVVGFVLGSAWRFRAEIVRGVQGFRVGRSVGAREVKRELPHDASHKRRAKLRRAPPSAKVKPKGSVSRKTV